MGFPLSFEADSEGACPQGWTCKAIATVCSFPMTSGGACTHPGLVGVVGSKYLTIGDDLGTGSATSPVFILPRGIDKIQFMRSGGADEGSGLYLHHSGDGRVLCTAEDGRDTNKLHRDWCLGLSGLDGEAVYITIKDTARSMWGKVLIDDIRLKDAADQDLVVGEKVYLI